MSKKVVRSDTKVMHGRRTSTSSAKTTRKEATLSLSDLEVLADFNLVKIYAEKDQRGMAQIIFY